MYRGNWLSTVLLGPWASFDNFKKKLSKLFGGLAWRRSENLSTFFHVDKFGRMFRSFAQIDGNAPVEIDLTAYYTPNLPTFSFFQYLLHKLFTTTSITSGIAATGSSCGSHFQNTSNAMAKKPTPIK